MKTIRIVLVNLSDKVFRTFEVADKTKKEDIQKTVKGIIKRVKKDDTGDYGKEYTQSVIFNEIRKHYKSCKVIEEYKFYE